MPAVKKTPTPKDRSTNRPPLYFLNEVMEEKRKAMGLSQQALAERCFLTQGQVSNLELSNGRTIPMGENLYWIAKALGLRMDDLVSETCPDFDY